MKFLIRVPEGKEEKMGGKGILTLHFTLKEREEGESLRSRRCIQRKGEGGGVTLYIPHLPTSFDREGKGRSKEINKKRKSLDLVSKRGRGKYKKRNL